VELPVRQTLEKANQPIEHVFLSLLEVQA